MSRSWSQRSLLALIALLVTLRFLASFAWAQVTPQSPPTAGQMAKIMAEMPGIVDVRLSPDGIWVAYGVQRRSVATNNDPTVEWLLQRVPQNGADIPAAVRLPEIAWSLRGAVRWCPDSRCLSMIISPDLTDPNRPSGLMRYDLATRELTPIQLRDTSATAGSPGMRPRLTVVGNNYQWSPRGNFIAFTAPLASRGGLDPRRGVPAKTWKRETWNGAPRDGLFVLEVATGLATQLTQDSLQESVSGYFDWAPDESALVVSVVRDGHLIISGTDLIVVDRASGTVRRLVTRPGMELSPKWSTDGRWIAFATHDGELSYLRGWPAVVPARGGPITTFHTMETPMTSSIGWWAPDSRSFYYSAILEMTSKLVRAEVTTRTATPLPAPLGELELPYDSKRSLSADRRWMAYTRESLTSPPELFVVELDAKGRPARTPRQLTRLTPDFPLRKLVHTETLSWPSPDEKFTIHSLLLIPASARTGGRVITPLPTLVFHTGGPGAVERNFAGDGFGGAVTALAALGYVVLVPNTRGRIGYGETFQRAIRDEKNRARGPYEDAMAGIDFLIKRGISDSAKLGVFGHSYGGYLTAYTITQTTRFRGAVILEGIPLYLERDFHGYERGTYLEFVMRDYFGIHNPFDPAEQARLIAESPGLNVDRVKTPTLLQYGARASAGSCVWCAAAESDGQPFFNALRRFNVPSALFVYDEGHVFSRPAAIADGLTRTAEWLDHWVRGIPFPDAERAREYNEWRAQTDIRR